jgi:2-keto-4-pentenoate hydratase
MRVAECEVVFRMGARLSPRGRAFGRDEVLEAMAGMHPGIEVPDSRFERFEQAGEAQLIADCACMNDMVVGALCTDQARLPSLPALPVRARLGDGREHTGVGANVLGDPVEALVWVVNELTSNGCTLEPGQFVTTGACVPPFPVVPGDLVDADFGWLGRIQVRFSESASAAR